MDSFTVGGTDRTQRGDTARPAGESSGISRDHGAAELHHRGQPAALDPWAALGTHASPIRPARTDVVNFGESAHPRESLSHLRSVLFALVNPAYRPNSPLESTLAAWSHPISVGNGLLKLVVYTGYALGAGTATRHIITAELPAAEDVFLGGAGVAIGEVLRRAGQGLDRLAQQSSMNEVLYTPRTDSQGVDRTLDVAMLLERVLNLAPDPASQFQAAQGLIVAMAIVSGFSRALADLSCAQGPQAINAALQEMTGGGKSATINRVMASALRPMDRDVRAYVQRIEARRLETDDCLEELQANDPAFAELLRAHAESAEGRRGDLPISDERIRAAVAAQIHREPLDMKEGGVYYNLLEAVKQGSSKRADQTLRECFLEAMGMALPPHDDAAIDAELDRLIPQVRARLG